MIAVANSGRVDSHRAAGLPLLIERHSPFNRLLDERAVLLIVKQKVLHGVVGDRDVDPAIAVEVAERHPQRLAGEDFVSHGVANPQSGLVADFRELALTVVAVEVRMCAGKVLRSTIGPFPAGQRERLGQVELLRPLHVVADEQIEVTIVVVVEESAACAPIPDDRVRVRGRTVVKLLSANAHFLGDVDELRGVVPKEAVSSDGREVQIFIAVVVVIADSDSLTIEADREAGLLRDVGELAVSIVPVEGHRWLLAGCKELREFRIPSPARRVHEQDVRVAIVVVIEKRHAAPHRFRQQLLSRRAVFVDEVNPRRFGDVGEWHERYFDLRPLAHLRLHQFR